jgi:hypothetical protein
MAWPERSKGPDVPPRAVPGFAEAVAGGRVPRVPAEPPALGPRPSAQRLFRTLVLGCVLAVPGLLALHWLLVAVDTPDLGRLVVLVGTSLVLFWALFARLAKVGRRSIEEFRLGYTTLILEWGGFWVGEGRFRVATEMRTPWDYSALWHLDGSTGRVIRPPSGTGDPPGMYPSPTRPGSMELWTGVMWQRHFEDAEER